MKINQICQMYDRIYEVSLLTNGQDVSSNWGLSVRYIVEQTEKWETYKCTDVRDGNRDVVIKIYRGNIDLSTNPNLHLGYVESREDIFDPVNNTERCFIFEVAEGDYDAANHPDKYPEKKPVENQDENNLVLCMDEVTGEEYVMDVNSLECYYKPAKKQMEDPKAKGEKKNSEPKGFACVAGMDELKKQLQRDVLFPLRNKELMERYKLHPLNGMLLYGNPGCGKTFIAEKFAEESGMNFEMVSSGSLSGKYIHETANAINEMFERAKKKSPCVLCIDEIDAICPSRSDIDNDGGGVDWHESVNEFLSQMNNCSKDGIFVIGTTNNPQLIDKALLRTGRMDKLIYVPMPDEECRWEMLFMYLDGRPQDNDIDLDLLAKLTSGMTASDIECMVNSVAMDAAIAKTNITSEALIKQAKVQRRSGVIPNVETMQETKLTATGRVPRIVGFSKVG